MNAKYEQLVAKDAAAARRLLENWLLSVRVGLTAVHKLREVDEDFDADYLVPQLKQEPGIGDFVDSLVSGSQGNGKAPSAGVQVLLGGAAAPPVGPSAAGSLLNLLTRADKRIEAMKPGAKHTVQLDQADVLSAVKAATFDGVSQKQGDDREDDKQEAPVKAIKEATAAPGQGRSGTRSRCMTIPSTTTSARRRSCRRSSAIARRSRTPRRSSPLSAFPSSSAC